MSLKDRQLKQIADAAVQAELLAGRTPNTVNVERRIAATLSKQEVGKPSYQFQPIQADSQSDPVAFNSMLKALDADLSLAYEEVVDQNDDLISMSNQYETERRMIQLSVHKTNRRIQALAGRLANYSRKQIIDGSFRTFNQIDFEGNEEQGIPHTDAFVDLENSQATLRGILSGVTKHDLSKATYQIELPGVGESLKPAAKEDRPFQNILNDAVNQTWQFVVRKDKVEETVVDVIVSSPEKVRATGLGLTLHSPKQTTVTLYVSDDKANWKEMKTYTAYEKMDWSFDLEIQYIKLRFRKTEPDFIEGTVMEYFFGASTLSLKRDTYAQESRLVSTRFPVEAKAIDRITLATQDVVAPKTNLHYYVGVDDGINFIEWQEVLPNQSIQLHHLGNDRVVLNTDTDGYGELAQENFGISFYCIATLPEVPIAKKTALYGGEYMWRVDTKILSSAVPKEFMPTYQDWQDLRGIETAFIPIEKTYGQESWSLMKSSLQKFTTYVQCEKEESVYNSELNVGTAYHQVYVNNSLVKPQVSLGPNEKEYYRYTYRFQPGWNKIEILTYSTEDNPFKPDLYLRDISSNVYAMKESMQEVSIYDLFNNTSKRAVNRFAVDGNQILVNYNPMTLDASGTGMRYVIAYEYAPKDARTLAALRFMAVLSRDEDSEHITPILKGYQLILE